MGVNTPILPPASGNATSLGGDALPSNAANGFLKRNAANNAWEEVAYGSGSNTVAQGNDARMAISDGTNVLSYGFLYGLDNSTADSSFLGAVTAFPTGGQASAVQVGFWTTIVAVCGTDGDSVKLRTVAGSGAVGRIVNRGAKACAVFPPSGGAINGGSANASVTVPANCTALWVSTSAVNYDVTVVPQTTGASLALATSSTFTATGTSQGTAALLTNQITYVDGGSVSAANGLKLPPSRPAGELWFVFNVGGNATTQDFGFLVFPSSGETILPLAADTSDVLRPQMVGIYVSLGSSKWRTISLPLKSDRVSSILDNIQGFYRNAVFNAGFTSNGGSNVLGGGTAISNNLGYGTLNTMTPSGTTQTLDWSNGTVQTLSLASASGGVTLTLTNPSSSGTARYTLLVVQGSTARTVTFSPAVKWPGGVAPTISTGNGAVDKIELVWNGTNYYGTFTQAHA